MHDGQFPWSSHAYRSMPEVGVWRTSYSWLSSGSGRMVVELRADAPSLDICLTIIDDCRRIKRVYCWIWLSGVGLFVNLAEKRCQVAQKREDDVGGPLNLGGYGLVRLFKRLLEFCITWSFISRAVISTLQFYCRHRLSCIFGYIR